LEQSLDDHFPIVHCTMADWLFSLVIVSFICLPLCNAGNKTGLLIILSTESIWCIRLCII